MAPGFAMRTLRAQRGYRRGRSVQRIAQVLLGIVAGFDAFDDLRDGALQDAEIGLWVEADPEGPGEERGEDGDFAPGEILEERVLLGDVAEHGALEEPEQIGRAERDAHTGPDGPIQRHLVGAAE